MHTLAQRARPFIGSRSFYAGALKVMVPVTIQQLINNMFNMIDNLMVGSLDINGLAMSAVTVANRPYTIFFGVFFGMTGAAGLLISQYYGARDQKTCQGLFGLQLVIGLAASLAMGLWLALWPESVMHIFVSDPHTVALGMEYLSVIWLSYLPLAVSNVCVFSMRAIGENRTSMLVSLATMGVNALCNYAFIFGRLGMPAMGVRGAALGTLIARMVEMLFYLWLLLSRRIVFSLDLRAMFALPRTVIRAFALKAVPLILNEILWNLGMNVYFWSYARINEAALPAVTIGEQIATIAAVMAMGNSSAVSVLIGAELGAGRLKQARENCKKLITLVLCIGLACVLICLGLGVALPNAFAITPELRALAGRITVFMGVFAPFNFLYGLCFFCMRAGGDTRSAMLLDSGYMWVVPVPASLLMALLAAGRIDVGTAVLVVQTLTSLKVIPALWMLKKGRWVRNITAAEASDA